MASQRKQKITGRAMLELKMPGEVRIASDGRRIAFSVSETDWEDDRITSHVYVTTTAEDAVPRQATRGLAGETSPHWSPNGNWLAFFTARDEEDDAGDDDLDDEPKQQVYLLPMDGLGGEAEKLTSAPEGVATFDWLPDSSGIVYLAREPRRKPLQAAYDDKIDRKDDAVLEREEKFRYQIWRIGCEDKKARLVFAGDLGIGELAVSPDGKSVAYTTNYTGEVNDYHRADVWRLSLETGRAQPVTEGLGGKYHPVWAPDSQTIVFTQPLDPALSYSQENLYSVPVSGGTVTHLTADFAHDITGWRGVWFDAQGTLYFTAAIGTTTAIFQQTAAGFAPVVQGDEHIHDFHVAPSGAIAYTASGAVDVPEVLWLAPDADEPVTLTDLNEDWYEAHRIEPTELVRWTSRDGLEIEGLLTLPASYDSEQTYPLVLNLHGGPHGRAVQSLTPYQETQVYAAQGYAVLSPNYRGSEGYGSDFCVANRGDLGGGDFHDVLTGVDWAVEEGIADPQKLGVMGASYGGYLTNWIVGHTNRFQAAISRFGIFSLVTDFSNSQAPRWELEYLGGFPWDRPEDYARLSPASYVKNIQTPMLILHGEIDPNTFVANSQELYTALRLRDCPVQYVHYPREGHGLSEPQHRLDEFRRSVAWFDRYLRGEDQPATYRIGDKISVDDWELTVTDAVLQVYAGRATQEGKRYVEVSFVLRDLREGDRPLTIGPGDVTLTRGLLSTGRSGRPVGLPIDVLGQKVLAEGSGWKFRFTPPDTATQGERGLAAPLALVFRIPDAGGTYAFAVKDFPPITLEIPTAEKTDDKKNELSPEK